MRLYMGTVHYDVVFHTMLGMLIREGGCREFWKISEELQELIVGGCYGVEMWCHRQGGDGQD